MKTRNFLLVCAALLSLGVLAQCQAQQAAPATRPLPDKPFIAPSADTVFTATRQINCLATAHDGSLWVGTSGGLLKHARNGGWTKWTQLDGLPSPEIQGIEFVNGAARVITPRGVVLQAGGAWRKAALSAADKALLAAKGAPQAVWRNRIYQATPETFKVTEKKKTRAIALPSSSGTHISAVLTRTGALWAAIYGDGIWAYSGRSWKRALSVPAGAREITALAAPSSATKELWLGTRRAGVWHFNGVAWKQYLQPGEPFDHNAYAIEEEDGKLFVSTLEDGLMVWEGKTWTRQGSAAISTEAPRQMARFGGALWLRHGGGQVDRLDAGGWSRDVLAKLPRRKVSILATDATRLYAAQWGGWSEWDGAAWTHYLDIPEIKDLPLMSLFPDGDIMWIGTQSRGIAQYNRATRTVKWFDERSGLPDEWITGLVRVDGQLYAGTFVGGLARLEGESWRTYPELKGQCITALEPGGKGDLFVATRQGIWRVSQGGKKIAPLKIAFLDPEIQSLHRTKGGLFAGARTGLFFVTDATLG